MGSGERSIINSLNLSKGLAELSLWSTLHDGELTSIESDLLARTLTLRFDVDYVRDFHKFPEDARFILTISGVKSVCSYKQVPWPGGCSIPTGTPYEQQQVIVAEYRNKWREESLSWAAFEQISNDGLEVSSATLGRGSGEIALHLGLLTIGDYVEAYVRGEAIAFSIGERQVTPAEFVQAGEAYWEAFSNRR